MNAEDFLETIFGDLEGYLFIGMRDADGNLNQFTPFELPDSFNMAVDFIEANSQRDLYFSPMLYSVPRRKAGAVVYTPVVYGDTDMFDPERYLVPPSINVESSPGRYHSYWLLDENYSPAAVSAAAKSIAHTHALNDEEGKQAGADPSGWALTKLLRIPGSLNTKNGEDFTVHVTSNSGEIYSLADITDVYGEAPVKEVDLDAFPVDLPKPKDVLRKITASPELVKLYSKAPRGDQDWSNTLYAFVCKMARAGFTPEEALVGAWNAECNKYKRDGRPMSDLWEYDIKNAYADPKNKPRDISDRPLEEQESRPKDEGISTDVELALLTPEQHEMLTRTFIDEYVEWGQERTDAPANYHVASAFAILSTIFGEFGVGYPQFGELPLGLFIVIMGETTDTRKTTSRNMMKKFMRLVQDEEFRYLLTSDVTPESLLDALADKGDNLSSVYDRDEAQQLIQDIKGGKGYLKGFFETLNELYDGWAHGRIRKDKHTEDTPVNFVQYLMGIRSQIQDELEKRDFASGWGPRNIWVRGEAPPRNRQNSRLKQGDPNANGQDMKLLTMAMDMMEVRGRWAARVDRGHKRKMLFDDDAWESATDLEWDLKEFFTGHPRYDVLKSCIERLSINVMKAAILFAMHAERDKVALVDVLNARYYAAQWVEDLVIVVEGVNESMDQRWLDKIEKFILDNDGIVTYAKALKWAVTEGIRKRDFIEYVETLEEMNVIKTKDWGGRPALELDLG